MIKHTTKIKIVGMTFRIKDNPIIAKLRPVLYDKVELEREPDNQFTKTGKAVKVIWHNLHIGFIPEAYSEELQAEVFDSDFEKLKASVKWVGYKSDVKGAKDVTTGGGNFNSMIIEIIDSSVEKVYEFSSPVKKEMVKSFNEDIEVEKEDFHFFYNNLQMLSASTYKKRFYKEFNVEMVAKCCVKGYEMKAETIVAMWNGLGKVSAMFGTAIHEAAAFYYDFELYGRRLVDLGKKDINPAYPKNPILKTIIIQLELLYLQTFSEYKNAVVKSEVFCTSHANNMCGLIDNLLVIDEEKKVCAICDYKVNIEANVDNKKNKPLGIYKDLAPNKLTEYAIQLSFYAKMLRASGWTVIGIHAFVLEDFWIHYELKEVDIIL